jgi:hypothetical protein
MAPQPEPFLKISVQVPASVAFYMVLEEAMRKLSTRLAPPILSLGLVIALSMLTAACQHPLRVDNWESFSVVLERTACLGTCPVYTVKIDGSGLVEYVGTFNVATRGSRTTRIDPDSVKNLLSSFDAVNFLDLRDNYAEGCTDMPTTIISISFDGKTKRVSNYFGGCEHKTSGPQVDLNRLAQEIDTTAGTIRWIECGDGCVKEP